MSMFKKITSSVAIAGISLLAVSGVAYWSGARINTTKSIPIGLYWVSSKTAEKGDYVIFCPPQLGVFNEAKKRGYIAAGFCPGNYGYMMKKILAAKDDAVSVTDEGVRVNESLVQFSKPIKADAGGRILPRYQADKYTLGNSEVLLMTDQSTTSFDGRYFGPMNRSQILAVINPIFVW